MNILNDKTMPVADEFKIAEYLIAQFETNLQVDSNLSFTLQALHLAKELNTYRFWKRVQNIGLLRELHNHSKISRTYSGSEIEMLQDYQIYPVTHKNTYLKIDTCGRNIGSAVFNINSSFELFLGHGLIEKRYIPQIYKSEIDFLFTIFEQAVRENALSSFSTYVSATNIAQDEKLLKNTEFRNPAFNFNDQDFYWYSVDCSH